MQKKALRIISKSKYDDHTDSLFKEKRILKLEDLIYVKYGMKKHQFDKHMFDLKMEENKEIIEWKESIEKEKKAKQEKWIKENDFTDD